ncbi:hypothetical protein A2U01_0093559, partial [Trifolium medium]|nr:hypothetical protein [Trifolium medium]
AKQGEIELRRVGVKKILLIICVLEAARRAGVLARCAV